MCSSDLTIVAAASAEGGGGGLADINLGLTIWTVVLFALFAYVLAKFAWGPLLRIIEDREAKIREAVAGAEKANADAQALLEKHQEMLREAGREREEILGKSRQEAEQLKAELTAKARTESDQLVARAKQQIERETTQAIREIRTQVADIAVEAASKIVTSSLTPEVQRQLVDDYIASLPDVKH